MMMKEFQFNKDAEGRGRNGWGGVHIAELRGEGPSYSLEFHSRNKPRGVSPIILDAHADDLRALAEFILREVPA